MPVIELPDLVAQVVVRGTIDDVPAKFPIEFDPIDGANELLDIPDEGFDAKFLEWVIKHHVGPGDLTKAKIPQSQLVALVAAVYQADEDFRAEIKKKPRWLRSVPVTDSEPTSSNQDSCTTTTPTSPESGPSESLTESAPPMPENPSNSADSSPTQPEMSVPG